ncbi:MAG: EAL domain-containing protein [Bacilli bacterium]|nr:EAL domain-containing protein [Bacilli bacterium]
MARKASVTSKRFADFDKFKEAVFIIDAATLDPLYFNAAFERLHADMKDRLPDFDDRFLDAKTHAEVIEGKECIVQTFERIPPFHEQIDTHDVRVAVADVEEILLTKVRDDSISPSRLLSSFDPVVNLIVYRAVEFFGCSAAFLILPPKDKSGESEIYRYSRGKKTEPTASRFVLSSFIREYHDLLFTHGYSILTDHVEEVRTADPRFDGFLRETKAHSMVTVPFFAGGKLVGYLSLINYAKKDGKKDLFFADYVANSIGSIFYRSGLYRKIFLDETTNLPWVSSIAQAYPSFIAKNAEMPISIIEFDYLHFRMIARAYGSETAEAILSKTADVLRSIYPESLLARKNGTDVFLVVTPGIADAVTMEVGHIGEEIQKEFAGIMVTLCFGVYQVKDTKEEFDSAILKAALAHRRAKGDPFHRIRIFDEEMDRKEALSVYYANRFRQSVEEDDFHIFIQPKYNLEKEAFFGGEVLVRWKLNGQFVPPNEFIPQFEANGLTHDLDLHVLEKTCAILAGWLKETPEKAVPLSVNFSRVDFADPHLFESILAIIEKADIPHEYIEIEITESAYVEYEEQIISFIQKCHATNIKVLMDDFGSGISSFNSLKNLDIDCIKLDYKFLSKGGDNRKKRKIIEGIVSIARSISLPVVIEGVETATEAAFFRAMGVRYVQGYLFGKPMPVEEFEGLTNRSIGSSFENGDDSRLLLNEFLDANSNLNFFFAHVDTLAAIYRFDGQGLYPVLINRKLEQTIAIYGAVSNFLRQDLLSFFDKEKADEIRACLTAPHRNYVFSEKNIYMFHYGTHVIPFYMQGLLIQSETDGNRYYLFTASQVQQDEKPLLQEGTESLEWLLTSTIQGCAIIDKNGNILTHNQFLKKYYPSIAVGENAEDLFRHRFDNEVNLHRVYLPEQEMVFDVAVRRLDYHGQKASLLIFSELGNPGSYISEIGGDGFKFYDRLVSTMNTVAVCYVEIDLDTDSFFQINFKDHENFVYHDAINRGSYTGNLYQRFLSSVTEAELPEVRERMRLDNLIEACKAMSPFTIGYKLNYGGLYHRLTTKFYFDKGHHYACFFLEDTTGERLRDFDTLTACLTRRAGIDLMERHINEHPLNQMAFFILDLDSFKKLNDTYGHPLGDRVLSKIHEAFERLPSTYIYPTRMGGDEFCLLLEDRGEHFKTDDARLLIDDALRNIGHEVGLNKEIHASIGCALIPEDGTTIQTVYPKADTDLYNQKKKRKAKR